MCITLLLHTFIARKFYLGAKKVTNKGLFLRRNTHKVNTTLDDGQLVYVISSGQFVPFKVAHQCLKRAVGRHWSNSPV